MLNVICRQGPRVELTCWSRQVQRHLPLGRSSWLLAEDANAIKSSCHYTCSRTRNWLRGMRKSALSHSSMISRMGSHRGSAGGRLVLQETALGSRQAVGLAPTRPDAATDNDRLGDVMRLDVDARVPIGDRPRHP